MELETPGEEICISPGKEIRACPEQLFVDRKDHSKIKQRIAFHLLFSHNMTNVDNVPEYVTCEHGTLQIICLMRQHHDCDHTPEQIYGSLFSPEERDNLNEDRRCCRQVSSTGTNGWPQEANQYRI